MAKSSTSFKPGKSGNPEGKEPKEIDEDILRNLAKIGCTMEEISAVVGLSVKQLQRRFLKSVIEPGRGEGRATLRRRQWQLAEKGNATMLIWLGKQMLGQKDKVEHSDDDKPKVPTKVEVIWNVAAPTPGTDYGYDAPPVGPTPGVPSEGNP